MLRIGLVLVLTTVSACAARPSNPVAISQPGDENLTCGAIASEIERNQAEAIRLAGADKDLVQQNIAAGAVGTVLLFPMLFAMDLSNAEQIEMRALRDRNGTLERLSAAREC